MIKLMRLELKRNKISTYIKAVIIACIVMTGLIFLFAYMPHFDPNDAELRLFFAGTYDNVLTIPIIVSMAIFCVLSSVIYSRFVIEEYAGKRAILLFSYPLKRKRILFAKLVLVFLFITVAMIVSNILAIAIFSVAELISPLVNDTLSIQTIMWIVKVTIIMSVTASALSMVSMGIGFIKKSIPTTIVSSVAIIGLLGNFLFAGLKNNMFIFSLMGISIVSATVSIVTVMAKVNQMEVE